MLLSKNAKVYKKQYSSDKSDCYKITVIYIARADLWRFELNFSIGPSLKEKKIITFGMITLRKVCSLRNLLWYDNNLRGLWLYKFVVSIFYQRNVLIKTIQWELFPLSKRSSFFRNKVNESTHNFFFIAKLLSTDTLLKLSLSK